MCVLLNVCVCTQGVQKSLLEALELEFGLTDVGAGN